MLIYRISCFLSIVIFLLIVCVLPAHSQKTVFDKEKLQKWQKTDAILQQEAPAAGFRASVGRALPNVMLPAHVQAALGKLTLHADYDNVTQKGVPLYLVNRTGKPVSFASQDGDIYLKLEIKDENKWVRVQSHRDSWCGNSYIGVTLKSGEHYSFVGYMPKEGIPATVRYRTHRNGEIVSNSGSGRYLKSDQLAASLDSISKGQIPQTLHSLLSNSAQFSSRRVAVNSITYVAALSLYSQYEENAYIRREAMRRLELLDFPPKERAAIQNLLKVEWPQQRNDKRLFRLCMDALSGKSDRKEIAELTAYPDITWSILADLLERNFVAKGITDQQWNELARNAFELLPAALEGQNEKEKLAAIRLLGFNQLASEYLTEEKLFKWLKMGNSHLVRSCSQLLSQRLKYEELAKAASHLESDDQIIVLKALATRSNIAGRPISRNPAGRVERAFWISCAEKQPVKTVQSLIYLDYNYSDRRNSFNLVIHEPLREFLKVEAHLGANSPEKVQNAEEGYPLSQVVKFVGRWKRKKDVPIFMQLLRHPSYQRSMMMDGTKKRWEVRRYRVREEVKRILKDMDVPVVGDVVLEDKIALPANGNK